MALSPAGDGYVASSGLDSVDDDTALPIFNVERVQLQFPLATDFVAAQVANNVLVLALATGRILRIDLDNAADIDDIDLPKRPSEIGLIRRLFLDPSASHLLINTTAGENYYLHTQSRQVKTLSRLKGVAIESVAWNPSLPTASTREILIGAADGNIYETYIEPSSEFYRKEEKYVKSVYKIPNEAIVGLWADSVDDKPDTRRVLAASSKRLYHFVGRTGRLGHEGSGSIYTKLFEAEAPTTQDAPESSTGSGVASLALSPEPTSVDANENSSAEETFAWLTSSGVRFGPLNKSSDIRSLGNRTFNTSKFFDRSRIPPSETAGGRRRSSKDPIRGITLTQWHLLCFLEGRIVAINKLSEEIVYDQVVLEPGQSALALLGDVKKNTYWLITAHEIFEIAVENEDRDIWRIMLKEQKFDSALRYARGASQKDAVATASGDYLIKKGQFLEAAKVYGKSSKPFEEVALAFIDNEQQDALRKYLQTKLYNLKKNTVMQRIMIATWLIELYMAKLNSLDDTITTKAELVENTSTSETKEALASTRIEFKEFVNRNKVDLDKKTTYDIISSHAREAELLAYATAISDFNYVLSYWIQRERWDEALAVLRKQTDPSAFYKYSTVLMLHAPTELVEFLMRHSDLEARNLITALLSYAKDVNVPLASNQAVRYLQFCVKQCASTDAAVHNTLISIYAADPAPSEAALLSYLSSQSALPAPSYDADFALRLCIQHNRIQSCVHIYSLMDQYAAAVALALKNDEIELASEIADRPAESDPALRKKLWLAVAKKVIGSQSTGSIKTAIDFLKRCDLLRIEDLIPFFPDFVVIDDFKDEICAALESYSRHIDNLKSEMDDSAATAESIKLDIKKLDQRYAVVMPGERCRVCLLPLLSRQFFVFPSCQHGFHSDCLGQKVVEGSGLTARNRIRELQASIGRGAAGARREREVRELDGLVGREW